MGNWPARHDLSCWLGRKTSTQTNDLFVFLCLHIKLSEHTDAFSKAQMLPFCGLAWQKKPEYRKFPKYSDTQKICCNHSKIWTLWLYYSVMSPNDADGMANSVDPDQTAPLGAVWSGSSLFAQACLSKNLGSLRYSEETIDLGQATTTLQHIDTRNRTWAAKVASKGFTPAYPGPKY